MSVAANLPKSYFKANFKLIEQDLLNYQLMKEKIEEIIEELEACDFEPGPKTIAYNDLYLTGYGPKSDYGLTARSVVRKVVDATYEQAIRDMALTERYARAKKVYGSLGVSEMIRRVEAIDDVLQRLENSTVEADRLKALLIRKRYFEKRWTTEGLIRELSISRATLYRWCQEVIREIAVKLGFIPA